MPAYQPPFQLTHRMTALVADIAERLGAWKAAYRGALVPELRRGNRIRSLQASLAIEQNTLSVEQVTAVLAGKPVLGSPKEIQEVRNAFAAYEAMERWQPHRLGAHCRSGTGRNVGRNAGRSAGRNTGTKPGPDARPGWGNHSAQLNPRIASVTVSVRHFGGPSR